MKKITIRWLTMVSIMVAMIALAGCSGATEEIGTLTSPTVQDNGQGTVPDTGQDTIQNTSQDTIHEPPGDLVLTGSAEKGPMQADSSVEIYELDEDLNQTGVAFQTKIVNDTGQSTPAPAADPTYTQGRCV